MKRTPLNHQNKRGMALFMVLVALALLSVIATEILYSSTVDSRISRNLKERLQAQYLAQSAAKLAILRMYLYREARNARVSNKAAESLFPNATLNQIWSTPLPKMPLDSMKDLKWPGSISSNIESEGSKIPLNLIDGNEARESDATLSEQTVNEIKNLIRGKLDDDKFGDKYRDLNVDELVNNLKDWIDADTTKIDGGTEADDYDKLDYKPRDGRIPVLSEIHMIKGWNEELFDVIAKPHFSVLNTSNAIDPNYISMERLKAIHPALTTEDLAVIEKRRFEQPFNSIEELVDFISKSGEVKNGKDFTFGENPPKKKEAEDVFYINASGQVGETQRSYRVGVRFTYAKAGRGNSGGEGDSDSTTGGGDTTTGGDTTGGSTTPPPSNHLDESKKASRKFDKLYIVSIEELI